jgi:thiamine-phosphate pyrophosphorylase
MVLRDPAPAGSPILHSVTREQRLERLRAARLYFVCDGHPGGRDPSPLLEAALQGGVDLIQLREKSARDEAEIISRSEPFRRAADEHEALFILNDRPELVEACGADGVHVGQDDVPVEEARDVAGPEAIVGLSTHSKPEVAAAIAASGDSRPDQVSVGPIWETPTKEGRPGTGLTLIEYAACLATEIPWFAIGGIDLSNVHQVAAAGAERIVVVRAIRDSADPEAAARALREALTAGVGAGR